ncbi:MAG TPA: class D sortase [Gemmatimonadaceae bacterium]|nr:class D sortase [Gemmatimonadaceae bacterium]
MRRRVGALLYVLGGALLLHTGSTYARGALARSDARAAWERAEAQRAVRQSRLIDFGEGHTPVATGAPVARLIIPSIGLDEIVVEGVGNAELNAGPGHLPGSAFPGDRGNAVISAHRDRHFSSLGELHVGDTVHTETASGRSSWIVTKRRVVGAGRPALYSSAEPVLTLTTCWPIRYVGTAPDRLLIEGKLIASE